MTTKTKSLKSEIVSLRVSPEDMAKIKRIAEKEDRTMSNVLSRWIKEKLLSLEKDNTVTGARK